MECAGNVTLFKKGDIRIQFWHTGGRVRSITEYGNVSHRANRRYIHSLVTFTLILLEGAVLAMDHYKESYAISQDKKASRLSESISLSVIFLAGLYLDGTGTKQNTEMARQLLESVFNKNDSLAPEAAHILDRKSVV